jgi:hypothetical protein
MCGTEITRGQSYCLPCSVRKSRENLIHVAKLGRVVGHRPEARAKQAAKQMQHAAAVKTWRATNLLVQVDRETFVRTVQPRLKDFKIRMLAETLGVSKPYAAEIRAGRYIPHPRHWETLARMAGVLPP